MKNETINNEIGNNVLRLCAVCKSDDKVEFLTITDCNLCVKCQYELADGFQQAMEMDRSDYPEL